MENFTRRLTRRVTVACGLLLAAASLAACDDAAQTGTPYTIGLVTNNPNGLKNIRGFRDSLISLGPVNGRSFAFVGPDKPVQGAELEGTLKGFVGRGVDLIFSAGTPTGIAAHRITRETRVPVVFGVIADPVRAGVITDLARPNGNMTGVMLDHNQSLRLNLFLRIVPTIRTIAILYNPNDPAPMSALAQLEPSLAGMKVRLRKYSCPDGDAVSAALAAMPDDVDGLFLLPDSVVNKHIKDIVAFSHKRKLPVSGPSMAQVGQGAFMSYGFIHKEAGAQAARIAVQVLKGLQPGDLPVQTAESYLGFNLKSADRIGVAIPRHFLESAAVIVR